MRTDSVNVANRTVDAVIATENPAMALDMSRWELVNEILLMKGIRIPAGDQVPMLDTHDRSTVQKMLGSTRNLHVEGDKLIGTNHFSQKKEADDAFVLVQEKHLRDNSVGYRVLDYVTIEKGKSHVVDGRTFTARKDMALRVTTSWEIRENSVVPIGADQDAKNRSENRIDKKRLLFLREVSTMDFKTWLAERGAKLEDLDDAAAQKLRADYDAELVRNAAAAAVDQQNNTTIQTDPAENAAAATLSPEQLRAEGARMEIERRAKIKELGGDEIPDEVVNRCLDQGLSVEQSQSVFLESLRTARIIQIGSPGIQVSDHASTLRELEAAMLLRESMDDIVQEDPDYNEECMNRADQIRDISFMDILAESLRMDGKVVPRITLDRIRAAFSTTSLPIILGNVANKALLKGYDYVTATWPGWTTPGSPKDFKTQTRVRLTDTGELEVVNATGEVGHGGVSEEYEQYNIDTFAKLFAITRQNIINDDLSTFTRVPKKMGQKARQRVDKLVWLHFMTNGNMQDGVALFHATHSNLIISNAFDAAGLAAALLLFRKQTDSDGESINIVPMFLIIPPDLEAAAKALMLSDIIMASGSTDLKHPTANIHKQVLKIIVEPRLSNALYTNYSATTWYIAANPATVDTVEVGFLNGKKVPTVERFTQDPNRLGIIFRVLIDAGVKAMDHRGLQKNTA